MAQFLENQDEVNNIHHTSDLDNGEWHIFSCWVKYANNKWEMDAPSLEPGSRYKIKEGDNV
jgi:hypothetical protein